MVTLGEIARQAGVRPPLNWENGNQSGVATGTAFASVPRIHEPAPILGTSISRNDTATGLEAVPPAYLSGRDQDLERSASLNNYEQGGRQGEPTLGPSRRGQAVRSTSTPPDPTIPDAYRYNQFIPTSSLPIYSPASSAAGHYSTSSSPSYIQQPHAQQLQHQQPVYAYHTQYYAPQYPYPPPVETAPKLYVAGSSLGSRTPRSPVQQPTLVSPNFYSGQAIYYANPSPSPVTQHPPYDQRDLARTHPQEYSTEPTSTSRPFTSEMSQRTHQPQQFMHSVPYGQYSQGDMSSYLHYPLPGTAPQQYANYEVPAIGPLSPVMPTTFGALSSPQTPLDYSAPPTPYRHMPFGMPPNYAAPTYNPNNQRYGNPDAAYEVVNQPVGASASQQQYPRMPLGPPQPALPVMPTELARGHFAQAKLRDAAGAYDPNSRLPLSASERRRQSTGAQKMPRPPSHSPWALWVGNVPSDSTHTELWRFFSTRPPPGPPIPGSLEAKEALEAEALSGTETISNPDYDSCGIESIHLISRSNCCFVNMSSKRHLEHAIKVCNGQSLRPSDPRCKTLVCRVRKKEDDNKTGVGAQRGKGMHQAWVAAEQDAQKKDSIASVGDSGAFLLSNKVDNLSRNDMQMGYKRSATASTSSTTSSFLARHFPQRYFILKSHTEEDLYLSVERGLWATQSHNEPVLDQAFRTSESIFLIFGANKTGEFFGYAKMSGPILKQERRVSWVARSNTESGDSSGSSGSSNKTRAQARPQQPSIPELEENPRQDMASMPSLEIPGQGLTVSSPLASPSASALIATSPQPMSEAASPYPGQDSYPAAYEGTSDYLAVQSRMTAPPPLRPESAQDARRGGSLDPRILADMQRMQFKEGSLTSHVDIKLINAISDNGVADQLAAGMSEGKGYEDEDGIKRKDTALSPEERNARLEILEKEQEQIREASGARKERTLKEAMEEGWGRPFKVEWIRVQKVPFHRTKNLRNGFNGNREVKISRDGTEVEPIAGAHLLELFYADPTMSAPLLDPAYTRQPVISAMSAL